MLSIEKCREILKEEGRDNLTDEQIIEIRNLLYELGELALDSYFESKDKKPQ